MKLVFFLIALLYNCTLYAQKKFDYKLYDKMEAIVIFKAYFDPEQRVLDYGKPLSILEAGNIYWKGKYYPLSYFGHLDHNFTIEQDSSHADAYKTLVSFRSSIVMAEGYKEESSDFTESVCFADSAFSYYSRDSNSVYYYGGEQYIKDDAETIEKAKRGIKVIYIAFKFVADMLCVWESDTSPFYMANWACSGSYNFTNGSSNPTMFLVKKYQCAPLVKEEQQKFGFIRVPKFAHYFVWCY